jgi:hypothetical protein
MKNQEVWADVKGYEGIYQISTFGNIKSNSRILIRSNGKPQTVEELILKVRKGRYYNIKLRKEGVEKTYNIHQLVAVAFLNHKPNGHELVVDHIDMNELNNHVSNLRLITHSENLKRAITDETRDRQRLICAGRKRLNGKFY